MRRNWIIAPVTALAALAVVGAGCNGDDSGDVGMGDPTARGEQVSIKTFMFEPDPAEVEAGTTVEWTNEDEILHTVTSGTREKPAREFDHELDGVGTTARVSFDRPGTYEYFCSVHDGMDGRVIVR